MSESFCKILKTHLLGSSYLGKDPILLRTHKCGELCKEHVGQKVVLMGWARAVRDHKEIFFINLTDRYGWVQVCLSQDLKLKLARESFLRIEGEVIAVLKRM